VVPLDAALGRRAGSWCAAGGLTGVIDSGRGAARAEDAQGTPTQSHISPSILVYEEKRTEAFAERCDCFESKQEGVRGDSTGGIGEAASGPQFSRVLQRVREAWKRSPPRERCVVSSRVALETWWCLGERGQTMSSNAATRELVFKAHKLLYHSTLGLRLIKKRRRESAARFGNKGVGSRSIERMLRRDRRPHLGVLEHPSTPSLGRAGTLSRSAATRERSSSVYTPGNVFAFTGTDSTCSRLMRVEDGGLEVEARDAGT